MEESRLGGEQEKVQGGETAVRMDCMREEYIFFSKKILFSNKRVAVKVLGIFKCDNALPEGCASPACLPISEVSFQHLEVHTDSDKKLIIYPNLTNVCLKVCVNVCV